MNELLFGTAGIPRSCEGNTMDGIRRVKELGLGAMELEFVRSVNISEKKAPEVDKTRKETGMVLTCHGSYFINLNSIEQEKVEASKARIMSAARRLHQCGGWSVCFHAGFYQKTTKEEAYKRVLENIKDIVQMCKDEGLSPWIRTETTGKGTQFGNVDELLSIAAEVDQVMPVVDFSHLHARTNGKYNTYDEFSQVLSKIEGKLGRKGLNNMHIHVSGIAYGEKGEKHHLNLDDSDLEYTELMQALRDYKVKGVLICESPNIEDDALLMQRTYGGKKDGEEKS